MRLLPKDRDLNASTESIELTVRGSDLRQKNDEVSVRLDTFLGHFLHWRSRTSIQTLIRDGFVSLDPPTPSRPAGSGTYQVERRPGRRLVHGTKLCIEIPEPLRVQRSVSASSELVLLHEDAHLLVVDKPPNLPVHPSGRHLSDTLIQRVHAQFNQQNERREFRIKLCHRLDRETSGAVLLARDPQTHAKVMRQFEVRDVDKEYHAIVRGVPDRDSGVVDLPLAPDPRSEVRLKMAPAVEGLESRTAWRVLSRYEDCALMACKPLTGRQHQIRVHMEAIGHPLVGDKLYGVDESIFLRYAADEQTPEDDEFLGLPRHALHNHYLKVTHPQTGVPLEVRSPIPEDMQQYLNGRERRED